MGKKSIRERVAELLQMPTDEQLRQIGAIRVLLVRLAPKLSEQKRGAFSFQIEFLDRLYFNAMETRRMASINKILADTERSES